MGNKMTKKMTDNEIREKVRQLKVFYTNVAWHVVFNFIAMTIWLFLGGAEYWPIFVHLTSAMMLSVDAYRMGLIEIPESDFIPFLREDWEEEKFKELKTLASLDGEKDGVSSSADNKKSKTKAKAKPKS